MLKGSGTIVMLLSSLLIQGTPGEGCCYPTISKGRKPNWITATGTARPASAAASNCKNSTFMSLRVCVCVCVICYLYVWHCMYVCMFVYVLNCVLFSNLFRALCCLPIVTIVKNTVQYKGDYQYSTIRPLPPSLPPCWPTPCPKWKGCTLCSTIGPVKWIAHKW